MTESSSSSSSTPKGKKGKKKNQTKIYIAAGIGAVVVYYLYKQHVANTAAASGTSTSGIDPLTGQPYAAGVGSLAGSGGGSGIGPIGTATPTDTTGSSSGGIDPLTGQPYSSEVAYLQGQLSNQSPIGGGVSTTNPGGPMISTQVQTSPRSGSIPGSSLPISHWTSAAVAQLTHFGVAPAAAHQAVADYLNGKPITNAHAAQGLRNITSAGNALGGPPTRSGIAPPVRVAKVRRPAPMRASRPAYRAPVQTRYR